jgi:hypothetical protein
LAPSISFDYIFAMLTTSIIGMFKDISLMSARMIVVDAVSSVFAPARTQPLRACSRASLRAPSVPMQIAEFREKIREEVKPENQLTLVNQVKLVSHACQSNFFG